MSSISTITVTVPTHHVADVYEFVANLFSADTVNMPAEGVPAPHVALTYDDVREAFCGGTNNQPWKDLLVELSRHPDTEVHWPDLCDAVGYSRRVMSGVIGAGERRTKAKRPYSKRYVGDETYFLMSADVAQMVERVVAEVEGR